MILAWRDSMREIIVTELDINVLNKVRIYCAKNNYELCEFVNKAIEKELLYRKQKGKGG